MIRIFGTDAPHQIDEKRLSFPGKLRTQCPNCGKPFERDFSKGDDGQGFDYPFVNQNIVETLYCNGCDHEWSVTLRIEVTIKVVE